MVVDGGDVVNHGRGDAQGLTLVAYLFELLENFLMNFAVTANLRDDAI